MENVGLVVFFGMMISAVVLGFILLAKKDIKI
jgi:hypothetical protein